MARRRVRPFLPDAKTRRYHEAAPSSACPSAFLSPAIGAAESPPVITPKTGTPTCAFSMSGELQHSARSGEADHQPNRQAHCTLSLFDGASRNWR